MKKALLFFVLLITTVAVFSVEVDRKELEKDLGDSTIEFVNYYGPHTYVNTREQIRGIGSNLATAAKNKDSAGDSTRYRIIHAVDPNTTGGFDADILILGVNATVDHIDNIRSILSSYLSTAYSYSEKDANTLAFYITIYNAVYRGNMKVFQDRYKPVVIGHLSADNVGISTRYDQWPGKTRLVIPLSDSRLTGTISTIDTAVLSDSDITKKIREEDGAGLDTRKDMVELKDRESDEAQKRAEVAQKQAVTAKEDASQKKKEVAQAEKDADQANRKAKEARKDAEKNPKDSVAQKVAEEREKEAKEKTAVAEKKKENQKKAEKIIKDKEGVAEADQALADTKQKEALVERKEIASDTQKVIDKEANDARKTAEAVLASVEPGYALRVIDKKTFLSELVLVNLANGELLKTSPLNSIHNRMLIDAGDSIMAVAGKKGGSADVTLVLINPETLEMTKSGDVSLSESSILVKNGNDYYAVIEKKSGDCVLGRFNSNLELKASSAISVLPQTAITVTPRGLLVQDSSAKIRLLRATDLVDQTN